MLEVGRKKIAEQNLQQIISLQTGDSESMPFGTAEFDAVMCAYGVRNFEHLEVGADGNVQGIAPRRKGGDTGILTPYKIPSETVLRFLLQIHTTYTWQTRIQTQQGVYLSARVGDGFPRGETVLRHTAEMRV